MKAEGLFFLRYPATPAIANDGQRSVMLPVVERVGPSKHNCLFVWSGPDAAAWYDANSTRLKAGTPLNLRLDHIQAHSGEIFGHVVDCEFGIDRWDRKTINTSIQTSPQPALPEPKNAA